MTLRPLIDNIFLCLEIPWDFCNCIQVKPVSLCITDNIFQPIIYLTSFNRMFLQQRRAISQAASHVLNDWRYCLSLDNENRCRQSLKHNLKLYDMLAGSKTNEMQGSRQQKCASILVSLCSVEGQPSFLFTLRSTALDMNKGDVRSVFGPRCAASTASNSALNWILYVALQEESVIWQTGMWLPQPWGKPGRSWVSV